MRPAIEPPPYQKELAVRRASDRDRLTTTTLLLCASAIVVWVVTIGWTGAEQGPDDLLRSSTLRYRGEYGI